MDVNLRQAKIICRTYLKTAYTDMDLIRALDFARAGRLAFDSCCCFAGIPSAASKVELRGDRTEERWSLCRELGHFHGVYGSSPASWAYNRLGNRWGWGSKDAVRRRLLIPMILAEIKYRQKEQELGKEIEHATY